MPKKHKRGKSEVVLGFAWYRPEQWSLLRELAADPETLEPTHTEWVAEALKSMADLRATGADVRRIDVDVHELATWCRDRGRPLDGSARAAFVTGKLSQ